MKTSKKAVRLTSILAAVFIIGSSSLQVASSQILPIFNDVEAGNPYYVPIKYLKEQSLIQGYNDGYFRPYQKINRAEALKLLQNTQSKSESSQDELIDDYSQTEIPDQIADPVSEQTFYFADVPPEEWFFEPVKLAWDKKIVEGYPDKLFHPERTINRVEALKITLLYNEEELPVTIETPPYTDVPTDSWYAPYAQLSRQKTLILVDRTTGGIIPDKELTRGEYAELIYRLIKSKYDHKFVRSTWYGFDDVNWGTASGEAFDVNKFAAAHKTLPFGTKVLVYNQANGKEVEVIINDRGPYATGIDLDLTRSAFEAIASIGAGIIVTEYKVTYDPTAISEETITEPIEYGF
jgi:hypothetical protein